MLKKSITIFMVIAAFILMSSLNAVCEAKVLFGFEEGLEGFEIPDWAYEQDDMVGEDISASDEYASEGSQSLKLETAFPGGKWTGAVVEVMEYFDWLPYSTISADIYLPATAPEGLKAEIILTVGENWEWKEMRRAKTIWPGKWTTITGDLKPGSESWKRTEVDDWFRQDVRKIDIRIISNNKPEYEGPVYIDNIRVE